VEWTGRQYDAKMQDKTTWSITKVNRQTANGQPRSRATEKASVVGFDRDCRLSPTGFRTRCRYRYRYTYAQIRIQIRAHPPLPLSAQLIIVWFLFVYLPGFMKRLFGRNYLLSPVFMYLRIRVFEYLSATVYLCAQPFEWDTIKQLARNRGDYGFP